jgi:hypothetical protein
MEKNAKETAERRERERDADSQTDREGREKNEKFDSVIQ